MTMFQTALHRAGRVTGLVLLAAVGSVSAPGSSSAASAASAASTAPSGASPAVVERTVRDTRITESSGLARSTYARPVLFTHNDSGDRPRVFAIGKGGRTRAALTLRGATAVDWEDIATGRGHAIWVADIGDNGRSRRTVSVYRFREPRNLRTRTLQAKRFDLAFEDGSRDAEALMVNPRTGRLFVVSKETGAGSVYRAPATLSTSRVNLLRAVAPAPGSVTAGAFSPAGRRYAVSTYTRAHIYRGLADRTARAIALPTTTQGESVEFARGGSALLRGSEGVRSPVFRVPL